VIFLDQLVRKENRYSLGTETTSNKKYLSIPVANSFVDYEEYYEITLEQFDAFDINVNEAVIFADRCRQHMMDDLLIVKPGLNRGVAI
jgi:hypothetical protein